MKKLILSISLCVCILSSTKAALLWDDFNGSAGTPLDSTKWEKYVDDTDISAGWGEPGGDVYQDGDGWAKIDVASEWTGSGFYTKQTFSNTRQYHIEGKVEFTRGTNNADNIKMIIRNSDDSYRNIDAYMEYLGPQIRFDIHPTHYSGQGGFTSVYITPKNNSGWQPQISTSEEIMWEGTNIVTMSCDYNADTGQIDFKLYNADKTSILTEGSTIIDSQTLADIGTNFKVEFGMDGYNSYDSRWDYVEIVPEPATILLLTLGGLVLRKSRR